MPKFICVGDISSCAPNWKTVKQELYNYYYDLAFNEYPSERKKFKFDELVVVTFNNRDEEWLYYNPKSTFHDTNTANTRSKRFKRLLNALEDICYEAYKDGCSDGNNTSDIRGYILNQAKQARVSWI